MSSRLILSVNNKAVEMVIKHFFTIFNTRYRHLFLHTMLASIRGTDPCMSGFSLQFKKWAFRT